MNTRGIRSQSFTGQDNQVQTKTHGSQRKSRRVKIDSDFRAAAWSANQVKNRGREPEVKHDRAGKIAAVQ